MADKRGLPTVKKSIVLLSGGLDSAVSLYLAKKQGFSCHCIIFDYGQRHKREIESAKRIAKKAYCPYQVLRIKLPWKGSSLIDRKIAIPRGIDNQICRRLSHRRRKVGIPSTYVPGRNIIFLSFALSFAETVGAQTIFIGTHSLDYSGYPDCRAEFYRSFSKVISTGTRAGKDKRKIVIKTPLIHKNKAQIIKLGIKLGVPFKLTWSCYQGGRQPCGKCDSCYFRAKGFTQAGILDPLIRSQGVNNGR